MLYLVRRQGEAVIINNEIEVRVVELRGNTVKLGFNFPPTASVLREELYQQIGKENESAANSAAALAELTKPIRLEKGLVTPPADVDP